MSIKVRTYQSKVRPATYRRGSRAPVSRASLNVGNTARFRTTQVLTDSADKVNRAMLKQEMQRQEVQRVTDLLDESTKYTDATRAFEAEYKKAHLGKDARNSFRDWEAFHLKLFNKSVQRFAGDKEVSFMWKRQAAQIRDSSLNRAINYADEQDKVYRSQVTAKKTEMFFQKVVEATSDEAVINLGKIYNAEIAAINTPEDTAVLMAQADRQVAETRINTAIARDDVKEAQRLLTGYREAGVLGKSIDEMTAKVRKAITEEKAFNISQQVRDELPEGTKTEKLDRTRALAGDDKDLYKSARYQVLQDHSAVIAMQAEQDRMILDLFESRIQEARTPEERDAIRREILTTPMRTKVQNDLLKKNAQGLKQPLVSDPDHLRRVEQGIANGTLTDTDLANAKWHLSAEDFRRQSERRKEVGGNRVNAFNLAMEDRLAKAFREDGKKSRKEKTRRFKAAMDQFVDEFKAQHSRLPSDEEMSKHEKWLLQDVIYDEGWLFDSEIERFMVDTLEADQFDVPADFKKAIQQQNRAAGGEPLTDEQIINAYRRYLNTPPKTR